MSWLRKVWAWLRDSWEWVLFGLALGGIYIGARRILRTVRDELELRRAKLHVERLRADREELERDADRNAASLRLLESQLREQQVRAVRAYEEGQHLRGKKLEKAIEELGL